MVRFEVGKSYYAADSRFDPVEVIKRTEKMILVKGYAGNSWRMRIKEKDGSEYCVDSSVPKKWQPLYEYNAKWKVEE